MFKVSILKILKKFFKERLYTYGYEYFSYGKILSSKSVKFIEIPVSMIIQQKKIILK